MMYNILQFYLWQLCNRKRSSPSMLDLHFIQVPIGHRYHTSPCWAMYIHVKWQYTSLPEAAKNIFRWSGGRLPGTEQWACSWEEDEREFQSTWSKIRRGDPVQPREFQSTWSKIGRGDPVQPRYSLSSTAEFRRRHHQLSCQRWLPHFSLFAYIYANYWREKATCDWHICICKQTMKNEVCHLRHGNRQWPLAWLNKKHQWS